MVGLDFLPFEVNPCEAYSWHVVERLVVGLSFLPFEVNTCEAYSWHVCSPKAGHFRLESQPSRTTIRIVMTLRAHVNPQTFLPDYLDTILENRTTKRMTAQLMAFRNMCQ